MTPLRRRRRQLFRWSLLGVLGVCVLFTAVAWQFATVIPPGNAERTRVRYDLEALSRAIKLYKLSQGDWPQTLNELWAPPDGATHWRGPYLESSPPLDPWGNVYRYRPNRALEVANGARSCAALGVPHGCPSPGRFIAHAARDVQLDLPTLGPAVWSHGADGLPGGDNENADLWLELRGGFVQEADWIAEVESDLRVIRRAIGVWEEAHPGARLTDLRQLPANARRRDPWGAPYVYLPETTLVPSPSSIPFGTLHGAHVSGHYDPDDYALFTLGSDRAWGGVGLAGERGWSSRAGAFSPERDPARASPQRRVLIGLLSGASVILLPSGLLLLLVWLRRRRKDPPPPAEIVLVTLGGRCAFCHDDAFGVTAPCPNCGALLHGTCWLEAGACPTLGCNGRPKASFALPQRPATIKPDEPTPLAEPLAPAPGLTRTA